MNNHDPSQPVAIELRDVSMQFAKRVVLSELNIQVREREFLALLGPSGCGKSTLVRIVSGLVKPTSGSVWLFGKDQSRMPPNQRNVAFVSQDASSYDHLTVLENLQMAERLRRADSVQKTRSGASLRTELIDRLQLTHELTHKPPQLSGGQLQRLAIARAILSGRAVVLYDEPLAHLNESLRQPIRYLIRDLHDEYGQTCIYITHDPIEAMLMGDRIAILNNGSVEQIDVPEVLYDVPETRTVAELVERPTIEYFPEFGVGVRSRDWQLVRVESSKASDAVSFQPAVVIQEAEGIRLQATASHCRRIANEWWLRICLAADRDTTIVIGEAAVRPDWLAILANGRARFDVELLVPNSRVLRFKP